MPPSKARPPYQKRGAEIFDYLRRFPFEGIFKI